MSDPKLTDAERALVEAGNVAAAYSVHIGCTFHTTNRCQPGCPHVIWDIALSAFLAERAEIGPGGHAIRVYEPCCLESARLRASVEKLEGALRHSEVVARDVWIACSCSGCREAVALLRGGKDG